MPGLRQVIRALSAPWRATGGSIHRVVDDIKSQAPGARMIGEFAVRAGVAEVNKKINPRKPDRV